MHLELTDEQTEALIRELTLIIQYDRSPSLIVASVFANTQATDLA